jgi:2-phosphosulfolactate phosphatase
MSDNKKKIEVCFSPSIFPLYDSADSIVVVIDILRATSSICVAFENGASEVVPVAKVDDCLKYKEKGFLVAGERNGEMLPGFDFGNSPFTYMNEKLQGKSIAITTTNGTQAIEAAKNSYKVVVGSFLNIGILSGWLLTQNKNVLCLCAGWKNKFNLEDTLFAGALTDNLLKSDQFFTECDSALAANYLYGMAKDDLYAFLSNSSHRKRLKRLNIEKDIEFCLMQNLTKVIPVLEGESLRNLNVNIQNLSFETK